MDLVAVAPDEPVAVVDDLADLIELPTVQRGCKADVCVDRRPLAVPSDVYADSPRRNFIERPDAFYHPLSIGLGELFFNNRD